MDEKATKAKGGDEDLNLQDEHKSPKTRVKATKVGKVRASLIKLLNKISC